MYPLQPITTTVFLLPDLLLQGRDPLSWLLGRLLRGALREDGSTPEDGPYAIFGWIILVVLISVFSWLRAESAYSSSKYSRWKKRLRVRLFGPEKPQTAPPTPPRAETPTVEPRPTPRRRSLFKRKPVRSRPDRERLAGTRRRADHAKLSDALRPTDHQD